MNKLIFTVCLSLIIFLSPHVTLAGDSAKTCPMGTTCIDNPIGGANGVNNVQQFIGKIIQGLLGVVGSIALIMFVWGGFQWMTSAGNAKKVDSGRDTMLWAALGLALIFSSYALVRFVIDKVGG